MFVEETGTGYVELLGRGGEQTPFNYFAKLLEMLYAPEEVRLQFHLEQGNAERPNVWVHVRRLRYLTTDDETRVSLPLESFNPEKVRTGVLRGPDEFKRQLARLSRVTQDKLPSAKWIGLTVDFSYQAAAEKMRRVLHPGFFQRLGRRANTQRNEIARTLFGGMRPRFGGAQDPSLTFDGQDLAAATGFSPQLKTAMRDLAGVETTLSRELDYGMAETGKNVIIGVVDFGCDFAHASVRKEWKSKILALWDQNASPEPPCPRPPIATAEEACVEIGGESCKFGYGRVFKRSHIEQVLTAWQEQCPQDREAPYSMLGYNPAHHYYKSPQPGSLPEQAAIDYGHGTLVLDICAGASRPSCVLRDIPENDLPVVRGVAPDADIIFVQVRTHRQEDGRRILDANDVIDAVAYIFHMADKEQRDCVVNLSLNTMSGPHDGDGHFERRLASLLRSDPRVGTRGGREINGRAVVVAAGNLCFHGFEARLWQHIADEVQPNRPFEFFWTQPAGDPTRNSLEIWYEAAGAWLDVTLISPSNEEFGPVQPGRAAEILRDGKVCGSIIGSRVRPTIRDNATTGKPNDPVTLPGEDRADGRHVILLQLDTKATRNSQWTVRLQVKAGAIPDSAAIAFHAWLERDDEGQSGIRRSLSNDWIKPRDREATIGTLSCGEDAIVVAAYDTSTGAVTDWHQSARGPRRLPDRPKPDISAPGVDLRLVTAGTQDGCMRASGTSLAAPFVTGTVACLYEASPGAPLATIKDALFKTAREGPSGDASVEWSPIFGHGRVFPSEAVAWIKARVNTETDGNR